MFYFFDRIYIGKLNGILTLTSDVLLVRSAIRAIIVIPIFTKSRYNFVPNERSLNCLIYLIYLTFRVKNDKAPC